MKINARYVNQEWAGGCKMRGNTLSFPVTMVS